MELLKYVLKYVYLYAQKSIIKAGNNKFQDLINASRIILDLLLSFCTEFFINEIKPSTK